MIYVSRSTILAGIKEVVEEHFGTGDFVTEDASFANDLGLDSLDKIELMMFCEKYFEISIPDKNAQRAFEQGKVLYFVSEISEILNNAS